MITMITAYYATDYGITSRNINIITVITLTRARVYTNFIKNIFRTIKRLARVYTNRNNRNNRNNVIKLILYIVSNIVITVINRIGWLSAERGRTATACTA